ncbi:MAG: CBS domain-containing protein [Bacteroidota bacterium]|jgi:CBS domain-containing protein
MASVSTFYLSRIIGCKVISENQKAVGKLQDLVVDLNYIRPRVIAAQVKFGNQRIMLLPQPLSLFKNNGQYEITCSHLEETIIPEENVLYLAKHILDKQIVDIDGKKLERVNDLRLATLESGTYVIAVDVGMEGLFRRLGIAKPIKRIAKLFKINLPTDMILWDDIATISMSHEGIKLAKEQSKLSTLHPSDLADIIEDLDHKTQLALFASLDDEQAADVLEELETEAQVNLLESMSVEKAADVLEKMPADEVADILDDLDEEKAEELLNEMEDEASEEVRELMEYPENTVGSLMTTEHLAFKEHMTVEETIAELRKTQPASDSIYYLYVLDDFERLVATVSIRDIIVSMPDTKLSDIMNTNVIEVNDTDKIDSLAEIISKYNLLAIPVVDEDKKMLGMVIIDDVVFTLLKTRRRKL